MNPAPPVTSTRAPEKSLGFTSTRYASHPVFQSNLFLHSSFFILHSPRLQSLSFPWCQYAYSQAVTLEIARRSGSLSANEIGGEGWGEVVLSFSPIQ
jgi:hypothetical protein